MKQHLPYDIFFLLLIEAGVIPHHDGDWFKMTIPQKHTISQIIEYAYDYNKATDRKK